MIELPLSSPNEFFAYKPADASKVAMLLPCSNAYTELIQRNLHFYAIKEDKSGKMNLEINFWEGYTNLESYHIPTLIVNMLNIDPIELFMNLIHLKYYISVPVDTSKIHLYPNYGSDFFGHPILISGFNQLERSFTVSDFFNYSNSKFKTSVLAFDELKEGFNSIQNYIAAKNKDEMGWLSFIEIFFVNYNMKRAINLNMLNMNLKYYMEGKNSWGEKGNNANEYCGFDIYDLVIEYINDVRKNQEDYIDFKVIYVFKLHYRLLRKQIDYISSLLVSYSSEFIRCDERFKQCEEEAGIALMLSLKYNTNKENGILAKLAEKIIKLKNCELKYTNNYIDLINTIIQEIKECNIPSGIIL
jgi:hypothetical protein